jgi:isopentenyl-diphosphate delta-isomerase
VAANGLGQRTVARKADHIRISLEEDVNAKGAASGFDQFRFLHRALPELDLDQVDPGTTLFGRELHAPILISSMTGGTDTAQRINQRLATVAQSFRLAIGLGSGRVLLEHPELLPTFTIRHLAPDVPIFANIGAVQLNRGVTAEQCRWLCDRLEADALILHFNPLQEALQPEGDTCFANLLDKVRVLAAELGRPVIAKEVGWGMAPDVAEALLDAGVSAIDVAGAGGTSWSEVERYRIAEPWRARAAAAFAGWGIPTADALQLARRAAPDALIFASGGIRSGLDMAKAIALGADLVGMAAPFLKAANESEAAAADLAREMILVLRVTMFCIGAHGIEDLRNTPRLYKPADLTALDV